MTGYELYGRYATALANQGVLTEPFDDLDDDDRRAWDAVASDLEVRRAVPIERGEV